jgi:outer membrane protein
MKTVKKNTMHLAILLALNAIATSATNAWAQSNLLASYQAAQQYDASFAAARASLEASKEKVVQSKSALKPTVNFGSNLGLGKQEIYGTNFGDRTYYNGGVTLSGSYPLWRPAVGDAISQAELGVRLAQASFANAQQELISRVVQAYFDVLLTQDILASIAAQKAAISEQLAQAKREFEVGTKTILDTNEAQARFDAMIAQEAVAKGEELSKRAALSVLTGTDPASFAALKSDAVVSGASPNEIVPWVTRAEEASISVQVAQINANIAKLEISRNQKLNGSSLDVVSSFNMSRNLGSSGSAARSTSASGNISLQYSYPVYNGGNLNSKVREAAINHTKTLADLEAAKRNAAQVARLAYLGLTYGINQIKALESVERSNKTLLESTKLGYQVGVRINLDVLNAQQAVENTKKDIAKARYDALISGVKLKAAAAQLTEQDLVAINNQLQ